MSDPHRFDDGRFWCHAARPGLAALIIICAPSVLASLLPQDFWKLWAEPPTSEARAAHAAWRKEYGRKYDQRQVEEYLAGVRPKSELRIADPLRSMVIALREDTRTPEDVAEFAPVAFRKWEGIPADLKEQSVTMCAKRPDGKPDAERCYPVNEAAALGDVPRLVRLLQSDKDAVAHGLPQPPPEVVAVERWPGISECPPWPFSWFVRQWLLASVVFMGVFQGSVLRARRFDEAIQRQKVAQRPVAESHPREVPIDSAEPGPFRLWPRSLAGWLVVLAAFPGVALGQVLSMDVTRLMPWLRRKKDAISQLDRYVQRLLALRQRVQEMGYLEQVTKLTDEIARVEKVRFRYEQAQIADDGQGALELVKAEAARLDEAYAEMVDQCTSVSAGVRVGDPATYTVTPRR